MAWTCGSVAPAEQREELGSFITARADAPVLVGDFARLVERDAQTLGSHRRSALLHHRVPAKTSASSYFRSLT